MPETFRRRAMLALQLVLGGILLIAAFGKLTLPWMNFMLSVDSYQILPDWGVVLVARFLPWVELLLGLLLISGFGILWTGDLMPENYRRRAMFALQLVLGAILLIAAERTWRGGDSSR